MEPQPLAPSPDPLPRRVALRFARLLLGADHDPALRSFFLVRLITVAMFATFNAYLGLWAIKRLHASGPQVGLLYAAGAAAWLVCGPIGGALSDRIGRKIPIVAGIAGQAVVYLALVPVHDFWLGMVLAIVAGIIAAPINPAGDALVADLV